LHGGYKIGVVAENFPLDGAEVFDRGLFKISLNFSCKSHVVGVHEFYRFDELNIFCKNFLCVHKLIKITYAAAFAAMLWLAI